MAGFLDEDTIADLIADGRARESSSTEIAQRVMERVWCFVSAKGVDHPTRVAILRLLHDSGPMSPSRASKDLGDTSLENLAYHFRRLKELGFIEVCDTVQHAATIEHVYRLVRYA